MNEIKAAERAFSALNHIPMGAFVLRDDFVVLFWNSCLQQWTSITRDDIVGTNITDHFPHLNDPKYVSRIETIFEGGPPIIFSSQLHTYIIPARLEDAQPRIQHTTVTGVDAFNGAGSYALFAIQDVTQLTRRIQDYRALHDQALKEIRQRKRVENALRESQERLAHQAFHDALTGLPNRTLLIRHLRRAVEHAKRDKTYSFAVLFLDLDRFKIINESLGHAIGDQLLIAISERLETCLRPGDTVARLGGDEFALLLDHIGDTSDAIRIANRIQKKLTLPFNLNGQDVFATTSIGIALSATGYDQPESLLRDADTAMHRAKALGGARHEVFDSRMHARAVELLQLETDLRRAIERQEFQLHYQPIVSLESETIIGFEALIRWQHPQRGLVSPMQFIPVAEETGLIIPIGRWVLREACRQMRIWQTQLPTHHRLTISVNLSGKQFAQPDLIDEIKRILGETGLDASSLRLEITESVIMQNAEVATDVLSQLRATGIQLHIDDFGTGYSSLSYLHRFPIDMLKIDRSFVSQIGVDGDNSEIVETIMTLARNLSINVIAEGVETVDQLAHLRKLQCEYGQGYLISKPLDKEAAGTLIAQKIHGNGHSSAPESSRPPQ